MSFGQERLKRRGKTYCENWSGLAAEGKAREEGTDFFLGNSSQRAPID